MRASKSKISPENTHLKSGTSEWMFAFGRQANC